MHQEQAMNEESRMLGWFEIWFIIVFIRNRPRKKIVHHPEMFVAHASRGVESKLNIFPQIR